MKNKFFRLTSLVSLLLVIILCFTSCSEVGQAQSAMENMFDLLKQGKYTEARDVYISSMGGDNDFLGCGDKFDEESFPAYAMHKELFSTLDFKVIKEISEEPAKVTFLTEIEAIDLTPIADRLFEAAEEYNFMAENNEGQISEEDINEFLTQQMVDISKEYINSDNVQRVKKEIEINVCYEKDRVWRVYPDDKLVNALTGGVYERYNAIMQDYMDK